MGIILSKEEKKSLRAQLKAGVPWKNVVVPGRTSESIRRHARRYNLIPKQRHPPLTEAQKARLRELKALNFSAREISGFDMLGLPRCTASTVERHICKLGLTNKNRSRGRRARKVWLNGEKQAFDNFLRENSKKFSPEQIAKKFDVVVEIVTARQRFLRVKTSYAETLAMPYVRKKIEKSSQERSRRMLLAFEKYIAEKEIQLENLAQKLRQKKWIVPLQEKQCGTCGKTWPKNKKFFFHTTHRTNFGTSWYFYQNCKICVAKQQHQKKVARYEKKYSRRLE